MSRKYILLNPGPVNTSVGVRRALLRGDLCHREIEFSQILQRIRKNLVKAFHVEKDFVPVFISGSGTAALEAALISCLDANAKTLVIDNGVYGARIAEILKRYRHKTVILKFSSGQFPDIKRIEEVLKKDAKIKNVAMVHHETSTGMLNPLQELGALCKRYRKLFFVDAISSLGGEPLDLACVDVCVGSANKCIQGLPGLAFVLIRKRCLMRMRSLPKKSLYLDLFNLLQSQERGGIPFTPAIPAFDSFDVALEELIKEGVKNRIKRYGKYSSFIRKELEMIGLRYFVSDPEMRSRTLTAYYLPKSWSYKKLHDALKKEGFVIYAGQGNLGKKIFRIANMGSLKMNDLKRLISAFRKLEISE